MLIAVLLSARMTGADFPVALIQLLFVSGRPGRAGGDGAPEYRRGERAVLLREDGVPALRGQLQPARALQLAPRQGGADAGI